jgi:type II secretory pathway pseudopilin PulG
MVVVLIIMLLVGLAVPSMQAVIAQGYAARSTGFVKGLAAGIDTYKKDFDYYPGQVSPLLDRNYNEGSKPQRDSNEIYGSQLLARAMFSPKGKTHQQVETAWNNDTNTWPVGAYVAYNDERILENADPTADPNVMDGFPRPKTVHYYPSKVAKGGTPAIAQYNASHGLSRDGEDDVPAADQTRFLQWIKRDVPQDRWHLDPYNNDQSALPVNDGTYILVAPGPDRVYFTHDDVTNIKNR